MEPLNIDSRIDDSQPFTQRGQRAKEHIERDVATGLEIGNCLAATTDPLGDPRLGAAARFALRSEPLAKLASMESNTRHYVRYIEHYGL